MNVAIAIKAASCVYAQAATLALEPRLLLRQRQRSEHRHALATRAASNRRTTRRSVSNRGAWHVLGAEDSHVMACKLEAFSDYG